MSTPATERPTAGAASTYRIAQLVLSGLFGLLGIIVLLFGGDIASVGGPLALTAAIVAAITAMAPRMGILATALGGAGAAGYLFIHKLSEDAGPSLCAVNDVFDCDAVNASDASEFLGVPISLFGLAFYLGVAGVSLLGSKSTPRFHQVLALFGSASVVYSMWLAWQSHSLGLVCLFCMSMWAVNLLLLVSGLRGSAEEGRGLLSDPWGAVRSRSVIVIAALFLIVTAVGSAQWSAADGGHLQGPTGTDASAWDPAEISKYYGRPNGELVLDGTEPILGSPTAPYLVVEFADFRCGHCADAAKAFPQIVQENPDVQVRFKVFPLTGKCNPIIPDDSGDWDQCLAAAAADCAHSQGKFWPMAHTLFENPAYFKPDDLMFMAKQLELDEDLFAACMNSDGALSGVLADASAGMGVKIEGTPTMFLRLPGASDFIQITHGIDALYYVIQAHKAGVELPTPRPLTAPY